jgi:hypothetical protein
LVISRQETPEGPSFIIKDPTTRRFFRFGEAEHLIAQQLNGSTSLPALRARLDREFGMQAGAETLQQFVDQLRRIRLLARGDSRSAEPRRKRRLFREVCSTPE